MEAGKSQLMNVCRIVKMPHSFPMSRTFFHADYLTPHSTAGQASSGTRAGMAPKTLFSLLQRAARQLMPLIV
jgi:hypothetical protein